MSSITSIDASIETVMVLEDIQAASLKTWFRNILKAADDQSLKELDWKPLVGAYLVQAKYMILRWTDDNDTSRSLPVLGRNIQKLAEQTDVRHMPDYTPINPSSLITSIRDFDGVKDHLVEGDRASFIVPDAEDLDFNLSTRVNLEAIEELAVRETQVHSVPSMVLIVRKPDYLGTSMWDLRHGRRSISAKIEDQKWLKSFQQRRVDVRPGDAIKCQVRIELKYGYDNELIAEKYYVEKINEVLEINTSKVGCLTTTRMRRISSQAYNLRVSAILCQGVANGRVEARLRSCTPKQSSDASERSIQSLPTPLRGRLTLG